MISTFFPSILLGLCIFSQESSSDSYSELCPCDLTTNSCDVNCCCDQYCSAGDRLSFTECSNHAPGYTSKYCLSPSTIIFNSTDYHTEFEEGLLCIYYDNYKQRNYYSQPQLVDTVESFDEYKEKYGTETFESKPVLGEDIDSIKPYYQLGDPIHATSAENLLNYFIVPQPVLTDYCNYNTPASFLANLDTACSHSTLNLATDCASAWHVNGRSYQNFQLLSAPTSLAAATGSMAVENETLSSSSHFTLRNEDKISISLSSSSLIQQFSSVLETAQQEGTVENGTEVVNATVRSIQSSSTGGSPQMAPPAQAPTWDASAETCHNVPVAVAYVIILGQAGRIVGAAADITYGSVDRKQVAFSRRFSVAYRWVNDTLGAFTKSGNPGYVVGLPVMAGEIVQRNNSESVQLSKNNNQWLTLLAPTARGSCANQERVPVLFGENIQTGCLIEISSSITAETCASLRSDALYALRGPTRNRIATYGNVSVERTGDWIPILVENEPPAEASEAATPHRGSCPNMVLSLHYEILFAYTGSASKPQAKIVGAKMSFLPARTISVQCIGPYCSSPTSNLTQQIPVVSSVTFIDVSNQPEAILAQVPTLHARLPYDFFYPFAGVSSGSRTCTGCLTVAVLICVTGTIIIV